MKIFCIPCFFLILILTGCAGNRNSFQQALPSPDSGIHLYFNLNGGEPYYLVYHRDEIVAGWSQMGFEMPDFSLMEHLVKCENAPESDDKVTQNEQLPYFFNDQVYNQMSVCLTSESHPGFGFRVDFRAYNDGIAFRYIVFGNPEEKSLLTERTELELREKKQPWMIRQDSSWTDVREIGINDTLKFPATFNADTLRRIVVSGASGAGRTSGFLTKQQKDSPVFEWCSNYLMSRADPETSFIYTPWRVIQFKPYEK